MKKKWQKVLVIGFSIIESITSLTIVRADTCTQTYQEDLLPTLNVTQQLNKGLNSINVNFSKNITFNGNQVTYLKLHTYYLINDTSGNLTNINFTETCNNVSLFDNFSNPSYVITYADGTQARVSGVEYDAICSSYNVTGGSANYQYQPEITNFHVALVNQADQYFMCDTDNNGIAKCPINGTMTIKAIRFYTTLSNKDSANAKFGLVTRFIGYCNSEEKEINNKLDEIQSQDIPTESKEAPNQEAFDNYENKENQIKQATSNADMSSVNIAMDIPTSNWIWETMTKIFNTNPIIMSMIITFLSIGVIKLILRR